MPRVAPITGKSDVAPEHHDVVEGVLKVFNQVRGPFSMLLHSPELAEQMLNLGNFYREKSIVAPKDRSLAILVGVRERQGAYAPRRFMRRRWSRCSAQSAGSGRTRSSSRPSAPSR